MALRTKEYRVLASASKKRYRSKKVRMRKAAARVVSFILLAVVASAAQTPTAGPATSSERQSPALIPAQTPALDTFNGSGVIDPLVPGVVKLSLLHAMDRGLKHNL